LKNISKYSKKFFHFPSLKKRNFLGKLIIKKEYVKIMGLASSFEMQQNFKRMNEFSYLLYDETIHWVIKH